MLPCTEASPRWKPSRSPSWSQRPTASTRPRTPSPMSTSWASSVPGKSPVEVVQSTAERVRHTAVAILDRLDTQQVGDGDPPGLDRETPSPKREPPGVATAPRSEPGGRSDYEPASRAGAGPQRRPRLAARARRHALGRGHRRRERMPDRAARSRAVFRRARCTATTCPGYSTRSPLTSRRRCESRYAKVTAPASPTSSPPAARPGDRSRSNAAWRPRSVTLPVTASSPARTWPSQSSSRTRSRTTTARLDCACLRPCSRRIRVSSCSRARRPER